MSTTSPTLQGFNTTPVPHAELIERVPQGWQLRDWNAVHLWKVADWVNTNHKNLMIIYNYLKDQNTNEVMEAIDKLPNVVLEEFKKKIDPEFIDKLCQDENMQLVLKTLVDNYIKDTELFKQEERIKDLEGKVEDLTERLNKAKL